MAGKARVPREVVARAGIKIRREDLDRWWVGQNALLGGKSLRSLWTEGRHEEVMSFIDAARSGDIT